jgi:hypothetical protein
MMFCPFRSRDARAAYRVVDFPAACGPGYQEQPVRLVQDLLQGIQVGLAEPQTLQFQLEGFPVQQPQHQFFAEQSRQGGHPHIHRTSLPAALEAAILGQPFFSDIHTGQDLEPGQHRFLEILRDRRQGLQDPIYPATHPQLLFGRFQVNVTGSLIQGRLQDLVGPPYRRCPGVPLAALSGKRRKLEMRL